MVKNPPANTGDMGRLRDNWTPVSQLLSPRAQLLKSKHLEPTPAIREATVRRSPRTVTREEQPEKAHSAMKTQSGHQFSSVQFSRSVVSDSLRPHESQHARPPYPSPTPGVHPDSTSIESVMPSSHLILCRPLLLLPPIPPSIGVFSNESILCMR